MFVKVCGLTEFEHIDWAVEMGYSAIGVVLHRKSPRFCTVDKARKLSNYARNKILTVAVGIDFPEVEDVHNDFDFIQIYEPKKIDRLIFAGDYIPDGLDFKYFVYDISRGSGEFHMPPDWVKKISNRLIISGGLNVDNIRDIISNYKCFGIDVSSGVEKPRGIKDRNLMKKFIEGVNNATR